MGTTKIDWATHSVNPVKGRCPNPDCVLGERCYARQMYKRFKWNPVIRYNSEPLNALMYKPPARVFVGSTMELFGPWVDTLWVRDIMALIQWDSLKQHTFVFLTKIPWNLHKWSPFPDNAWVGATVCNQEMLNTAIGGLYPVKAKVKFISFEPVMEEIIIPEGALRGISWVIIGGWSRYSPKTAPKAEWIETIVREADRVGAKVFLKSNLISVLPVWIPTWGSGSDNFHGSLRQELPGGQPCPKGGEHEWGTDGMHSNSFCKKCFESPLA